MNGNGSSGGNPFAQAFGNGSGNASGGFVPNGNIANGNGNGVSGGNGIPGGDGGTPRLMPVGPNAWDVYDPAANKYLGRMTSQ
jgi:hypothetical protein